MNFGFNDFFCKKVAGLFMTTKKYDMTRYVYPLIMGTLESKCLKEVSFLGSSFLINQNGLIATCAHVVESNSKELFVCNIKDEKCYKVMDVKKHSFADFAVIKINQQQSDFLLQYPGDCKEKLGHDVMSFGYTDVTVSNNSIKHVVRTLKGYISRVDSLPDTTLRCKSICELSFPSLPGCSGSPVMSPHNAEVLGMLYSNLESTIETFSFSEYRDDKEIVRERVSRIIEFGLMHTIEDIRGFLKDMNIKDEFV